MHLSTRRKKTKGHFTICIKKTKLSLFGNWGYYVLTYLLKHLHEFCGVEKRTRVNLKTILLLLLCMH